MTNKHLIQKILNETDFFRKQPTNYSQDDILLDLAAIPAYKGRNHFSPSEFDSIPDLITDKTPNKSSPSVMEKFLKSVKSVVDSITAVIF